MINLRFKDFFLDRAHVIKKVGEAKLRVMKRSGGRIRITAQRSMRYRKKGASKPGTPPFAHKQNKALLRKLLFFVFDPAKDSVVVGPVGFRKAEAPHLNEFGGVIRRVLKGKTKTATYPKRAYMAPALKVEEPKLPKEWANSVRGP